MMTIKIAEFSKNPGPRYIVEGPFSGEEFRNTILKPQFDAARAAGENLHVILDGVEFGYPSSFLEESFGGLARIYDSEAVIASLTFTSVDEPLVPERIHRYIRRANEVKPAQQ